METVSVKFNEKILKKVDRSISSHNFNSRTEFIREAVRDKLDRLSKDDLIREFMKFGGKAKKKTTIKENRKTRDESFLELARDEGWDV